jgi:UDP-N-acetylbacillosamine N-acetyltransferase
MSKQKKVLVIGKGSVGDVVTAILSAQGRKDIEQVEYPSETHSIPRYDMAICDVVVAIGDNTTREWITEELYNKGATILTVIDPTAILGRGIVIGRGAIIGAGAKIMHRTYIGHGVLIGTGAIIEHGCDIGHYNRVSPGAVVCGHVHTQRSVWIGAGATVLPYKMIGKNAIVGAGAVVTKGVSTNTVVVGNPAKPLPQEANLTSE